MNHKMQAHHEWATRPDKYDNLPRWWRIREIGPEAKTDPVWDLRR